MARSEQDHTCDACDGIGMVFDELHFHPDCPVCLGSGTISDRMPVADALADAETLHLNAIPSDNDECTLAQGFGLQARFWIKDSLSKCSRWTGDDYAESQDRAKTKACAAARAAFRAVPGLRGE